MKITKTYNATAAGRGRTASARAAKNNKRIRREAITQRLLETNYPGSIAGLIGLTRLSKYEILAASPTHKVTLTPTIHPVFARSRWPDTTDSVYETIKPAIYLASRLLTEDKMLEWWHKLCLGDVIIDEVTCRRTLEISPHLEPIMEISGSNLSQRTAECLESMSNLTRFRWALEKAPTNHSIPDQYGDSHVTVHDDSSSTMAETITVGGLGVPYRGPQYTGKRFPTLYQNHTSTSRITLNRRYLNYFRRVKSDLRRLPRDMCNKGLYIRTLWQFAVNLVHETAHTVCEHRFPDYISSPFYETDQSLGEDDYVWYNTTDPARELGRSWENWAFGGLIQPASRRLKKNGQAVYAVVSSYGMFLAEWEAKNLFDRYELMAVPTEWFAQWFKQDTWDQMAEYGRVREPESLVSVLFTKERNARGHIKVIKKEVIERGQSRS
ncbi:hypothetical protein EJ08DRAFT_653776 [Tothia fuscella]|uniref:Uncharacterized protein n=1 Tax=Tothia fuscella TaxID=1048955 RepID=A0A9P4NGF7_9PEZI|nr:hypothetical protein EJ08DRAFT_653776 [Tothia fuscella]